MKLEFHPEAESKLIEAAAYYELQVPGLGERFEAEIQHATDLLLQQPEIGAPPILFYSVTSDILRIAVVAHQSRHPGYWRSRVGR